MRALLFLIAVCLSIFAMPVLAQPSVYDLVVDADATVIHIGGADSLTRLRVAVSAGQHILLRIAAADRASTLPYPDLRATLPGGAQADLISYELPLADTGAALYAGPLYVESSGSLEYTLDVGSTGERIPVRVSVTAVEPHPVAIGGAVTFPLTARGSAFAVFPAQTDDRVDLIVESALDTEMMVISPLLTTTTADGDSGRGLNPELTQYWVRDSGYEYVYLANLSAAAGDVTLRVIDNPIPDVTIDGTVITISPNLRQPMPIFRLRYTAGSDYFIEIETIDGSPTGHPFIQLFRNGEAGELIRGEQAARIGYAFHAHEDGEIIFTIQDNIAPSNEYRVRGGAYFAG